ncbi:hypothetical protein [Glutamicibacter ardleyensis]|uniref:Uncharacterized protein n=1 Tax=Glutamicibacter ardleyensis TaxID=225894 RepID=A0ABQ2DE02_9MICC|nr:hypothetical protein [Glutamicibacter ardleyensis]GGJ54156.1 hypothetical protein GCM10007173_10910 [Glutamicibacter ardleyensis]
MTLNYPYDCTLEEHEVSAMYDRIMNLVKTRHPDARYACFHVNFDEDNESNPHFYLANLYDAQIEDIDTGDYAGPPYKLGIMGLAANGTTRAVYALGIPDEIIRQWDGHSVVFDLEEHRTLDDGEPESLGFLG